MREFGWTENKVMFGLTGARGWVYYSWSRENAGSAFEQPAESSGKRFIQQEVDRILNGKRDQC